MEVRKEVYVVMTEAPGPSSQFVELEDEEGRGVGTGAEWEERSDGLWGLGPLYISASPLELGEICAEARAGDVYRNFAEQELGSAQRLERVMRADAVTIAAMKGGALEDVAALRAELQTRHAAVAQAHREVANCWLDIAAVYDKAEV